MLKRRVMSHSLVVADGSLTVGFGESVGVVKSGVSDVSVRVDGLLVTSSSSSSSHHPHPSSSESEVDESGLLVVASSSTSVSVSKAVVVVLLHVLSLKLGLDSLSVGSVSDHGKDGSDAFDELQEKRVDIYQRELREMSQRKI